MFVKEFGARLTLKDKMSDALRKSVKQQQQFTKQIEATKKAVNGLGESSISPKVTIKDEARAKAERIEKKLAEIKKTVYSPIVRLRDQVSDRTERIRSKLKKLVTTYTPIVRIRDLASMGLAKIKNTLGGFRKVAVIGVALKDVASKELQGIAGKLKSVGNTIAKPFISIKDIASDKLKSIADKLKSVGSTVIKPFVGIKDEASNVLGEINDTLKTMAKGVTIAVAVTGAGVIKSLSEGAKLQQSMGGVETLFKDDASVVMENANKAFQTAGLSANDYMEQVTSFSASLLQSLGGNTTKSAQVADMAMVDMADNANKFGTDMANIQNAYQGFAKQNYTMLDNLKLGYGGTKSEMERLLKDAQEFSGVEYDMSNLSDVYTAIHVIQEELDITGTTAKEASSTFSGSFASMKSAFSNLMGNLSVGDGEAVARSMGELLETTSIFLFDNAIPMVQTIFDNLPTAIGTAAQKIAPKIKQNILPLITGIKDGIVNALAGIGIDISPAVETLENVFTTAMPVIQSVITVVGDAIKDVMPTISSIFQTVGDAISGVLSVIGDHMGLFQTIVETVVTVVGTVWKSLAPVISTVVNFILTVMDGLLTGIETVFNFLAPYIAQVWSSISGVFSSACGIIQGIVSTLIGVFNRLRSAVSAVFNGIRGVISSVCGAVAGAISGVANKISGLVDKIGGAAKKVKNFLGGGISKIAGALGFAYGKDRVPYNNYPAILHEGERVLTRNQADQYDRMMTARSVPNRAVDTNVAPKVNAPINAPQGENPHTKQDAKGIGDINIKVSFNGANINNMGDLEEIAEKLVAIIVKRLKAMEGNVT